MSDPDALNVWNGQRLVGRLQRNPFGHMSFRYDHDWLSGGGFAISQTLPLSAEEFAAEEGAAHRFFANLLPEGGFRERTTRDLKISDTDFNLLRAIGGECAGALSVLPVKRQPSTEQIYHPINDEELATLVAQRGQPSPWPGEKRPRFSLAGAQNKFPVLVRDGKYLLPQGESPSSHIFKFEVAEYRNVPAYETFTMLLARAVGLPVVNIQLQSIKNIRYTITERYDRFQSGDGEVLRAHQEDFCQALGYGVMKGNTRETVDHPSRSASGCFGMYQVIRQRIFRIYCTGRFSTCLRAIPTATPKIYLFFIRQPEKSNWPLFTILYAPEPSKELITTWDCRRETKEIPAS